MGGGDVEGAGTQALTGMPWLLDGNNLAQGKARERVRRAALDLVRGQRVRVVVVFDGVPPSGGAEVERLGQVEVRYVPDADAAIVNLLATVGGKGWRVATDDQELARRARQQGAEVVSGEAFWARAEEWAAGGSETGQAAAAWRGELEYFRDPRNRLAAGPGRVRRRPPGRWPER